ncbi:hypothetical protein [Emticicia oligotrophica]
MKKMFFLIVTAVFYVSCQLAEVDVNGIIEGKFTLSPLCGVEPINADENHPCGYSFEQLDTIYGQYKVQVIDATTLKVIAEKKMDHTGQFSFTVPKGTYNLDYQPHISTPSNITQSLPNGITLRAGEKITKDISINTGIR